MERNIIAITPTVGIERPLKMKNHFVLVCSISLAMSGCSGTEDEVPTDLYSKTLYEAGIKFETGRTKMSKENLLRHTEPILFQLKGRSCVLFLNRPNVAGITSVVCFDDETGEVAESFQR
jgi:hypothetical protein